MDDETGLINMAARLYDPLLGRFLSADTLIPQPGNLQSFNRYSYVVNNPLRYVDPTGHQGKDEEEAEEENQGRPGCIGISIERESTSGEYTSWNWSSNCGRGEEDNPNDEGLDLDGYDFGSEGNDSGSGNDGALDSTDVANSEALDSSPQEVEAEKEPTRASVVNWSSVLNVTHHALAVAGLTPLVGVIPDLLDVVVYGFQGDGKGMMVAGLAAVPGLGQGARGAQYGIKAARGIAAKASNRGLKEGKTFYRSMSKAEAEAVKKTGKLRGGNPGESFFTDSRFRSGAKAQDRLSLPQYPDIQMEFRIQNNPTFTRNGTRVTPDYGGQGGGREYMTTDPVHVEIINIQPF